MLWEQILLSWNNLVNIPLQVVSELPAPCHQTMIKLMSCLFHLLCWPWLCSWSVCLQPLPLKTVIDYFRAHNVTCFANLKSFLQDSFLSFNAIALILRLKRGIALLVFPLLSFLKYPTFYPFLFFFFFFYCTGGLGS